MDNVGFENEKETELVQVIPDTTEHTRKRELKSNSSLNRSLSSTSIPISHTSANSQLHEYPIGEIIYKKQKTGLRKYLSVGITLTTLLLYVAYFIAVLVIPSKAQNNWNYWCEADGFLIVLTALVATFLIYFQIIKKFYGRWIYKVVLVPINRSFDKGWAVLPVRIAFYLAIVAGIIVFLVIDTEDDRERLISVVGFVCVLFIGFLFSPYKRKIVWRHVIWGISIQFVLALISLRWPLGRNIFDCLSNKVATFIGYTDFGSRFVFGDLIDYHIFAFAILPVILFFSFFVSILYYYGIMQWVVMKLGWLLRVTVGTTACESVNAAANIFLGQTEAPLLIKPFLEKMTLSELHAVMTGGYATIAGAVMATYMGLGVSPKHLLTASVMNAPTALAFSKLMYPETQESKTASGNIQIPKSTEINVLHAAVNGVTTAIPLAANVGANLIAFIAFIYFFNGIFDWSCQLVDIETGQCSLENVFGYVFMPLAWLMGVAWDECHKVGSLIGEKTFINEFVAYSHMSEMITNNELTERAQTIATYALCGFSNISSIGMQMGALSGLCPSKSADLSKVAARAMVAGSLVCFLSACVAGALTTPLGDDNVGFNTTISWNVTEPYDSTEASVFLY